MTRYWKAKAGVRNGVVAILLSFFGPAGCDTDSLLEVDVPGRVPVEALGRADLAETLVLGVIGDFECAWDNYVAAAAVHSDVYWATSGNSNMRNWGQRRITADNANFAQADCSEGYGLYTPLHTARYQAADVFQRLSAFPDADVPGKTSLLATVRAYGGFTLVAFGEGFCSTAIDGGPELMPDEVLRLAEQRFSEAIDLASQVENSEILNMALVGRARVRLDLEDFEGAIDDAAQVPPGFIVHASRDGSDPRRFNIHDELVNNPRGERQATIAPVYRDLEWKGVPDRRVNVSTNNDVGNDGNTIHYFHDKTSGRDSPVLLASYKEAQLFIAEAAARTGDLDRAREILNERHALAGLPPIEVADAPTQAAMIRLVIEERRRELFVEGGHRLNDHLRFDGTPYEVPFKGEPGSYHPDGLDHLGLPYGTTTCWPLPTIERLGNPNLN